MICGRLPFLAAFTRWLLCWQTTVCASKLRPQDAAAKPGISRPPPLKLSRRRCCATHRPRQGCLLDVLANLCRKRSSIKTHITGGRIQGGRARAAIAETGKTELATIARQHVGPTTHKSTRARSSQTVAANYEDTGPTDLMNATASSMNEYRNRTYMTHAFNERCRLGEECCFEPCGCQNVDNSLLPVVRICCQEASEGNLATFRLLPLLLPLRPAVPPTLYSLRQPAGLQCFPLAAS
jgi:hypothetical protein